MPSLVGSEMCIRDQFSTAQRLHDDDPQSPGCCIMQSVGTGLCLFVEEVVLDLTKCPLLIGVDDLPESCVGVMEGEAQITDAPLPDTFVRPLEDPSIVQFVPALRVEGMQQVELDVVGLHALQLLFEAVSHVSVSYTHLRAHET